MHNDLLNWCHKFPDWIGFPIYLTVMLLTVALPIMVALLVAIFVNPWLLLLIPAVWSFFAIRWVIKNA